MVGPWQKGTDDHCASSGDQTTPDALFLTSFQVCSTRPGGCYDASFEALSRVTCWMIDKVKTGNQVCWLLDPNIISYLTCHADSRLFPKRCLNYEQKCIVCNMLSLKEKQFQVHIVMTVPLQCHLCIQQDTYFVRGTELSTL